MNSSEYAGGGGLEGLELHLPPSQRGICAKLMIKVFWYPVYSVDHVSPECLHLEFRMCLNQNLQIR